MLIKLSLNKAKFLSVILELVLAEASFLVLISHLVGKRARKSIISAF